MIRIAISQAAFDAIAATLTLGSVGYEPKLNAKGERLIWLEEAVIDRLTTMRGVGESYSDVILRLVKLEGRQAKIPTVRAVERIRNLRKLAKLCREALSFLVTVALSWRAALGDGI